MWDSMECKTPLLGYYNPPPTPLLGHYNPPLLWAYASSRVGHTLPAKAWLWYHLSQPYSTCVDIIRFGVSYPLRFCSPPKHRVLGEKASLHIKGRSFLINTFSCASLGDVGFHGMQDPSFWVTTYIMTQGKALATSTLYLKRTCHNWGFLQLLIKPNSTQ